MRAKDRAATLYSVGPGGGRTMKQSFASAARPGRPRKPCARRDGHAGRRTAAGRPCAWRGASEASAGGTACAHSTVKCNGRISGAEENLARGLVAEYLSGARVEFVLDPLDIGIGQNREVGTFWEVLPEEAVSVFVEAAENVTDCDPPRCSPAPEIAADRMHFPVPIPARCRETGNGNWEVGALTLV